MQLIYMAGHAAEIRTHISGYLSQFFFYHIIFRFYSKFLLFEYIFIYSVYLLNIHKYSFNMYLKYIFNVGHPGWYFLCVIWFIIL